MRLAVLLAVVLQVPVAPGHLRVFTPAEVCGDGIDNDTDGQIDEGCVPPSEDHAYFDRLRARPDVAAAYGLREPAQVEQFRRNRSVPAAVAYVYPSDPDPRRQDAMKITIPATAAGLPTQLWLPTGKGMDPNTGHGDQSLLVTWDIWWGAEFDFRHTAVHQYKGVVQFASPRDQFWVSLHQDFQLAQVNPQTQPPGGPYVLLTYPHTSQTFNFQAPTTRGGEHAKLPYGVDKTQQRDYLGEMLGPLASEFGVVPERWTRYWAYFERAPELDWDSVSTKFPGRMKAFRWSVWAADAIRGPVQILNEAIVAPNPTVPGGFTYLWLEMNVSASQAALDRIAAGRGPLTAYARNVVVLHGTSKVDVAALLQRP